MHQQWLAGAAICFAAWRTLQSRRAGSVGLWEEGSSLLKRRTGELVQVTGRLPTPDDLYALDVTRCADPGIHAGLLVHAPRRLSADRSPAPALVVG